MSHDCVKRINELLAPHNTALASIISFDVNAPERIALMTEKVDAKNRKKPVLFLASFCPMCGLHLAGDKS